MVILALLTLILVRVVTKLQAVLLRKYKPEQPLRNALAELLRVLAMLVAPRLVKNKAKRLVMVLVSLKHNVAVDAQVVKNVLMVLVLALNRNAQIPVTMEG